MKCCRICGNEREDAYFYKLKDFWKYHDKTVIWCKACQKLYMDMIKHEKKIQELKEKKFNHIVEFK